jgi:EmrB/QacA subfamily drug resistance transporter
VSTTTSSADGARRSAPLQPWRSRQRLTLAVLCLASFIAVVDTTIVSVALPSIQRELRFSGADAQWILNGYALTFGGLLLLFGRIGDLWGRRRMFATGLVAFAVASLIGGFATDPVVLVVARLLQGAAAAAFVPASLSLLTTAFPAGPERNRAVGTYGAMAALGFVVGMVGGGVLTELLGWRWVMFVNVPVVVAALLPARAAVAESRDDRTSPTVDVLGALTLTGGLAGLLYAISAVPATGWISFRTLGFTAAGLALLVGFVAAERRVSTPMVPLSIFTTRRAVVPNAAILLQSMVGVAWLYVLTLYFQDVLGHGPLAAGLLFLPMTLASVVAAALAGRLVTRIGPRPTAAVGLVLVVVGLAAMTRLAATDGLAYVLAGMVIGEAGFMLANVPLTIAGSTGTGEDSPGLSAGLLNTSMQLGNALGLGIVASVVASFPAAREGGQPAIAEALAEGLPAGLLVCAGFATAALLVVLFGLRPEARAPVN